MAKSTGAIRACFMAIFMSTAFTGVLGIRPFNMTSSKAGVAEKRLVPALVIFGDSTVDAGNNNYLNTIVKSDFLPYGQNFEGGVPTGRFTNGPLVTDFLSQKIGIPFQLPYLSPDAHGEAILTGINFASSASGWYDNTAVHFNVKGLTAQFEWYRIWQNEVLAVAGPTRGNYIISNALYAFSTGSNDWVNNYYLNPPLQKQYPPEQYIPLLLGFVRKYTQELYSLGGRNIAILSLPPLGCVPSQITLHGSGPGCVKYLNDVSSSFNEQLVGIVNDMKQGMPGARLIYVDIYTYIYEAFQTPQKYGYTDARSGCCGTGDLEVSILCNRAVPTCSNPDQHIFWDSFHPTSQFYSQLADQLYAFAKPIIQAPPQP